MNIHIERIERDNVFCQVMELKLGAFFMKVILLSVPPCILTGETTPRDKGNEPPQL